MDEKATTLYARKSNNNGDDDENKQSDNHIALFISYVCWSMPISPASEAKLMKASQVSLVVETRIVASFRNVCPVKLGKRTEFDL